MLTVKKPFSLISGFAAAMLVFAAMAPQAALATPLFSADTLLGSASPANSGQAELDMLREYAGDPLLVPTKVATGIVAIADDGQWYIDVGNAVPGFFMLKFGTGTTNQHTHYFFKNDGAVGDNKLVWTNAQVNFLTGGGNCFIPDAVPPKNPKAPDLTSCNIGRLSHYAFIGTADVPPTETEVPEPGSLALAGLGLLGLLGARRKFAN